MKKILSIIGVIIIATNVCYAQWDSIGRFTRDSEITSGMIAYMYSNEFSGSPSNQHWVGNLRKSTDGWRTWNLVYSTGVPMDQGRILDIQFINDNIGWMMISYGAMPFMPTCYLMQTIDGGATWTNLNAPNGYSDYTLYLLRQNYGYISPRSAYPSRLLLYHDGNWTIQSDTNIFHYYYDSFFFINDSTGFVCKYKSSRAVYRSDDYGMNWSLISDSLGLGPVQILTFTNDSKGYYLNQSDELYTSTDMGITWTYISELAIDTINVLYFLNPNIGWAASKHGSIFKTITGGLEWVEIPGYNTDEIVKMSFFTESIGYFISQHEEFNLYRDHLYRTIMGPWGIDEQVLPNPIRIAPNPVKSNLILYLDDFNERIDLLEIHSITGQLMFHSQQFIDQIDVSGYRNGVYLLCYQIRGKNYINKFIVL